MQNMRSLRPGRQAEVEPLLALTAQLTALKASGGTDALEAYVRNLRLGLIAKAEMVAKVSSLRDQLSRW